MPVRRPQPTPRQAATAGLTLAAAVAVVAVSGAALSASPSPSPSRSAATTGLPPPVVPAFTPGAPRRLGSSRHLSLWAPVDRSVPARAAPAAAAPIVAMLSPRTPEGTRNAVAVLERRRDRSGAPWVRASLAVLPNGTTGWIPRTALGGYGTVHTRLDVDIARLRATLYRDGRAVVSAAIAVGTASSPTPTGRFYIRNKLARYRSRVYGPVAFGTSARSPTATDWPAGGFVGIHGTDRPDLVPGRISHGCIRMRNPDILELARRMPIGTPVTIH
jgi:lipoprotein-anchoring transpeptidase ErfK/SrfK